MCHCLEGDALAHVHSDTFCICVVEQMWGRIKVGKRGYIVQPVAKGLKGRTYLFGSSDGNRVLKT